MPISPMDEYLAHQTTDTFDYVFTSDRNFYDRYYFNCHPSSDELFLIAGMGQYPNLGVTDAFVCISHGTRQYTVRASRELGNDRLDTSVGPLSVEVVQGLRGRVRPVVRGHGAGARGAEVVQSQPRAHHARREPLRAGRHVERNTRGGRAALRRRPGALAGCARSLSLDSDCDGHVMQQESVKVWSFGIDKPHQDMGRPEVDISYIPGTREMAKSVVTLHPPGGSLVRSINTPLRTVYLAAGSGRPDADWGHGTWRGEHVVQGLVHDMSTQALRTPWAFLNETLCRFELDTGEVGYGMHENMCIGIHRPSGFETADAVAP